MGANVLPLFYKRGQISTILHLLRGQMSSPVNHLGGGGGGGGRCPHIPFFTGGADVRGGKCPAPICGKLREFRKIYIFLEQGEVGLFFVFRYSIKGEVSLFFGFRFSFFRHWNSGRISHFDIRNPILTFEFGPNIAF